MKGVRLRPRAHALVVLHIFAGAMLGLRAFGVGASGLRPVEPGGRKSCGPGREPWDWGLPSPCVSPAGAAERCVLSPLTGLGKERKGTLRFPGLTAWATALTPSGLSKRRRDLCDTTRAHALGYSSVALRARQTALWLCARGCWQTLRAGSILRTDAGSWYRRAVSAGVTYRYGMHPGSGDTIRMS
jgi:hypothetical protein